MNKPRIAVLISGSGSNLQALIDQQANYAYSISLVISNRPNVKGLDRAEKAGIKALTIDHTLYPSREAFDAELIKAIDKEQIDFVILAGFMRILTKEFTLHYLGKMLNIHPSLLPKYPGLNTHQKALDAGDKQHGVSIHFVTPELDGGPVILQSVITVEPTDTAASLQNRIHIEEHQIYPLVTHWLAKGDLEFKQERPYYLNNPIQTPFIFQEIE